MLTPETRGIGLLEFHQIDRSREANRVAGAAVAATLAEQIFPGVPQSRDADQDLGAAQAAPGRPLEG